MLCIYQNCAFVSGQTDILDITIVSHFEKYGVKKEKMNVFKEEICYHIESYELETAGKENANLEVEWAKKVLEHQGLELNKELNEHINFTNTDNFKTVLEWFLKQKTKK